LVPEQDFIALGNEYSIQRFWQSYRLRISISPAEDLTDKAATFNGSKLATMAIRHGIGQT
jgi:hypothetical protein